MKNNPHPVAAFKHFGLLVLILATCMMAACRGGGSSGISRTTTVRALSLPDRIELTTAEGQRTAGQSALAAGLFRTAYDDAGSDYSVATNHTWVNDTDALDMINDILGVAKDTGYADFVNQGPYMALLRQVGESQQRPSGGSATSTTGEQLMEIYLEVIRASNSSPMIVKVWIEEEGPGQSLMLIRGYFSVTIGVSGTYPYGVMYAHFQGTALDSEGNQGADMFTMAMSVGAGGGNMVIKNVEAGKEGDAYESHRRTRAAANADVTEGDDHVNEAETMTARSWLSSSL